MLMYLFCLFFLMLIIVNVAICWEDLFFFLSIFCLVLVKEMWFEYENFHVKNYYLGLDKLSILMLILSVFIVMLMYSASLLSYGGVNKYELLFIFLLMSLFMMFASLNMMMFYFMYETVLIPTYLLILGWGYQPERLYAGNYLLLYMLFASLPLLVFLIYFNVQTGSLLFIYNFSQMMMKGFSFSLMGMAAFLVKVPMFMFHLWLPKAHVEAPVSGSMILAGVLLKMGGYGLIRMLGSFYGDISLFSSVVISVSMVGGVMMGIMCLRQMDLKSLIAYSSVVHMGLMLSGVFSNCYLGVCGAVMIMVGHGLCSSGMFYLSGVIYLRLMSRSIIINSGLMVTIPSVGLVMFLFVSSNMAAPPSLNFGGEFMLIASMLSWHDSTLYFLILISFFSGVYSMYLFSTLMHGACTKFSYAVQEMKVEEYYVSILHWAPLNLLVLSGGLFLIFLFDCKKEILSMYEKLW